MRLKALPLITDQAVDRAVAHANLDPGALHAGMVCDIVERLLYYAVQHELAIGGQQTIDAVGLNLDCHPQTVTHAPGIGAQGRLESGVFELRRPQTTCDATHALAGVEQGPADLVEPIEHLDTLDLALHEPQSHENCSQPLRRIVMQLARDAGALVFCGTQGTGPEVAQPLAQGDIAHRGQHPTALSRLDRGQRNLDGKGDAVAALRLQLHADAHGAHRRLGEVAVAMLPMRRAKLRRDQGIDRLALEFTAAKAEEPLGLCVGTTHLAGTIDKEDAVGGTVKDDAVVLAGHGRSDHEVRKNPVVSVAKIPTLGNAPS